MPEHSYTLMHGNTPCASIVFKELIVVYSDPEQTTDIHESQKYSALAATLQNDPPKKTEGWDKITTVGKNLFPRKDMPIKKTR